MNCCTVQLLCKITRILFYLLFCGQMHTKEFSPNPQCDHVVNGFSGFMYDHRGLQAPRTEIQQPISRGQLRPALHFSRR